MKAMVRKLPSKRILFLVVIGLLGYLLVANLPKLPAKAGRLDFRGYWGASYLLSQSENFSDEAQLLEVQRIFADHQEDYAIKTWNPPWILVWLLPYTLVHFDEAATLWLFTNIGLLFVSIVFSWHLFVPASVRPRWLGVPFLAAITFPSTLVAILFGQMGLLVLSGLVGFLVLYRQSHDFRAGLLLSLTMAKPHLIYLTIPIILLHALVTRRWRIIAGFAASLLASIVIVFLLRPTFLGEYLDSTSGGNLLTWETATFTTYLSIVGGAWWIRLVGVILLPAVIAWWWRYRHRLTLVEFVEITLFLSVITMPFGWSYDFVVLLLPFTHLWVWVLAGVLSRLECLVLLLITGVMYLVFYYQRIQTPSELYFFWVPLVMSGLYAWVYARSQRQREVSEGVAA